MGFTSPPLTKTRNVASYDKSCDIFVALAFFYKIWLECSNLLGFL